MIQSLDSLLYTIEPKLRPEFMLHINMSSSTQKTSKTTSSSSYFSFFASNNPPVTRASSSKAGQIPISRTAAYSWLQVQKIMELSVQQAESESQDNPISPDSHVNALTRISSVASSSASSVVTNDSSNLMQEMDNDTVPSCGIGPLNCGKPVPSITVIGDQNDQ